MKSIKTKLLIVVIVALLASTVSLGAVSFITMHKIMHEDADEMLAARCETEATIVNRVFRDMQKSVQMMESYADESLKKVSFLEDSVAYAAYTEEMRVMFLDIARNTEGAVTFYFRYAPELSFSSYTAGFCYTKQARDGDFKEIQTTDLSKYDPQDHAHVGWYHIPVNAGGAMWLDEGHSVNYGRRMVSFVIPFYKNGTLIGVIGMDADFATLTDRIDSIKVYQHGYAYLTDHEGQFLYCSPGVMNYHEKSHGAEYTEATTQLINGMNLSVRADYIDIQSESRPMLFSIVTISAILFVIFIIITIWLTNRIVNPLKRLAKQAEDFTTNGAEVEVELVSSSEDEIGTLSRVFKQTADKLREYMGHINALAYRDSLTGVKNRTAYTEASAEMERTMLHSFIQFGVLMADINGLKETNDYYGHDIGNQLIISSARLLCDTFSQSPVFRIGGDEFVVILRGHDFENYRDLVEKLDSECATRYIELNDVRIPISIARGVAVYNPEIDHTFKDVVVHADQAMYLHKQNFRK